MVRLGKSLYSREHEALVAMLRALRLEAGLAQSQLAARLARPQSFVSKYESGQRRLDVVELRAVCRALGADVAHLTARWERLLSDEDARRPRP